MIHKIKFNYLLSLLLKSVFRSPWAYGIENVFLIVLMHGMNQTNSQEIKSVHLHYF